MAENFETASKIIDSISADYAQILMWIQENARFHVKSSKNLFEIYDLIAKADLYLKRIINTGDWALLAYYFGMIKRIHFYVEKRGWHKLEFPKQWLYSTSRTKIRSIMENMAKKIHDHLHCSTKKFLRHVRPYLMVELSIKGNLSRIINFVETEKDLGLFEIDRTEIKKHWKQVEKILKSRKPLIRMLKEDKNRDATLKKLNAAKKIPAQEKRKIAKKKEKQSKNQKNNLKTTTPRDNNEESVKQKTLFDFS